MKILLLILMFTTTATSASGFADWLGGCGGKVNNFCHVKIGRVYDGDTFYVNISKVHSLFGKDLGIRVKGIDTPELRGGTKESKARGILARDFAANLLKKAKRVDLKDCSRGKFFRIVCDVYLSGLTKPSDDKNKYLDGDYISSGAVSLATELLKAGLAEVYDK